MSKTSKKPGAKPKNRPTQATEKQHNIRVFTLFSVIIAVSALIVSVIYLINKPPAPVPQVDDLPKDMLPREVMEKPQFFEWFASWHKADGYLRLQEFRLEHEGEFDWSGLRQTEDSNAEEEPLASRYVWSPEHTFYLDYLDGYGIDQVVVRLGSKGVSGELFSRAAPGYYHDAFWLDGQRFILFGTRPELKSDGSRLCITQDDQEACYERLTVDLVDVATGSVRSYVSEKHNFSLNPYKLTVEGKWRSSLTDLERAEFGVSGDSEITYGEITGIIESVGADGEVTINDNGATTEAALAAHVQIIDYNGKSVGFDYLKSGLAVKAVTVEPADASWTVIQRITATEEPKILLYAPTEGESVGVLRIKGAAPQGVDEIVVRARNRRSGVRFVDESISLLPGSSPWQEFAFEAELADFSRAGDFIAVAVYDAANQENGYLINVRYEP